MFTDLFSVLKAWIATSTGTATVAVIILVGLVLTVLFVVATYNTYMELVQTRKNSLKETTELKDKISTLEKELQYEVDANTKLLKSSGLAKEQWDLDAKDLADKNLLVCNERDDYSRQLLECSTNKDLLNEELGNERNVNSGLLETLAHIAVGFRSINEVLGSVIKSKATVLKTYAFNFNSMDGDSVKLETVLFVDAVAKLLGFDSNHNFGLVANTPENPDNEAFASTRVDEARDALLSRQGILSPVYFIQVLYIRSLDLKIVLTDFVANPLQVTQESRPAIEAFYEWINSPSVVRSSTHTLVLDKHVWGSMEDSELLSFITQGTHKSLYTSVDSLKAGSV